VDALEEALLRFLSASFIWNQCSWRNIPWRTSDQGRPRTWCLMKVWSPHFCIVREDRGFDQWELQGVVITMCNIPSWRLLKFIKPFFRPRRCRLSPTNCEMKSLLMKDATGCGGEVGCKTAANVEQIDYLLEHLEKVWVQNWSFFGSECTNASKWRAFFVDCFQRSRLDQQE